MPELSISTDQVGFLIVKAREFDAKEEVSDPDEGSNATDDGMIDVLEDNSDDPVAREIAGFIDALTVDEQIDLVTLLRLGRGDGTAEDWDTLRAEVASSMNTRIASYLLGQPMLGDLLAEGLDEIGLSFDGDRTTPIA
ncbi:hypothetical protein ASC80_15455 [Afipia sp. Root123D2]|uniref:DUF3775 domain-containing protein n=1 Tax=Afipia sp. Root123D2 TaxID=1736436 RepID=UPI0006FB8F35|nr:DUF3775 domain-containing protein [Afipia sp. Root123D2]KQW18892.1 hypothetical protein ASC80_15455 [Afipia sp. Root123D2]